MNEAIEDPPSPMRYTNAALKALFIFVSCCSLSFADVSPDKQFVQWIKQSMEKYAVPGVSIVVMRDYKIEWVMGFGVTNVFSEQPVTDTTLFQAGSISKPVAAVAVLKAIEDGKLDLDSDVNQALTSWRIPYSPALTSASVNVRELLSHTSGANIPGFLGYAANQPLPSLLEVLNGKPPANSPAVRIVSTPGESYSYSGGGYLILQQALIDAYNKPFAQIVNDTIFDPLGMTNSTFVQPLPASMMGSIATPYRPGYESIKEGPHVYVEQAAMGLWTTPFDLAKLIISLQESLRNDPYQILSPESAKLLMSPEVTNMGLGFYVNADKYGQFNKQGRYFMHGGQSEGYRCLLIASTRGGYGAIIMTNMSTDGRLVMSGKVKDDWSFMEEVVRQIADMEGWY